MGRIIIFSLCGLMPVLVSFEAYAVSSRADRLDPTEQPMAIICLLVFIVAYGFVIAEQAIQMRKSKAVVFSAGLIWVIIGLGAPSYGVTHAELKKAVLHDLDEYAALALFLLVAMTYINAIDERAVFDKLRSWFLKKGFSYRRLFWITGITAFFLSAIADNITTALVMGAVIMAIGQAEPKFITLAMINVVVAANAGGAFSPFGDVTTLMVWQSGHVDFFSFFSLFLPSLVNWLVPALIMGTMVSRAIPPKVDSAVNIKRGAKRMCILFLVTITMAVSFEQFLGLPPFIGMMTGLSFLMLFSWYLRQTAVNAEDREFDIFTMVSRAEWDTLLFFFGVIFAVGGLAYIGYLSVASSFMYGNWGPTVTHIFAGVVSAIVDNIPVMFAILTENPDIDHFQWLLITLTTGVGGSLLSVGSAAGVALMGRSNGMYTFVTHLRWSWVIALGYMASIGTHFLVNA